MREFRVRGAVGGLATFMSGSPPVPSNRGGWSIEKFTDVACSWPDNCREAAILSCGYQPYRRSYCKQHGLIILLRNKSRPSSGVLRTLRRLQRRQPITPAAEKALTRWLGQ